ncbi:ribonuclease D [Entomomonas sp. E2T0]|uniref:ribonuclease D n=1 Tax=Entomomonas sp. E2T0 TaxID=2930213 RepID=UPI0022280F0A|nr:ribonuclease D [Entomomonas sp. E2T0]UYZ84059.1 ribonuclease D [Entomomonas sp. E2T0]
MLFNVVWIRDNKTLIEYCSQWQQLPFITLDTEFLRETTFYPIAGLIQLSDGKTPYLIDPLTISDWSAFSQLLQSKQVIKVLHACSEDLELLFQLTGVITEPVFDTQVAAAFLGMGITLGYSPLVNQLLNKEISKEEKRSDWLQRPLSSEQEQYAAADVMYLIELYHYFVSHLSAEKQHWLYEDTKELAESYAKVPDFQTLYKESRQAWRLSRQQLAVLKALYAWREEQARAQNIARGRLLKDNSLLMMAKYQPSNLVALAKIPEVHPRTLRKEGNALLGVIQQAAKISQENWPQRVDRPLSVNSGKLAKELKKIVQQKATELNICPELLWRKRIIEKILYSVQANKDYQLPDSLKGWRKEILSDILLQALN